MISFSVPSPNNLARRWFDVWFIVWYGIGRGTYRDSHDQLPLVVNLKWAPIQRFRGERGQTQTQAHMPPSIECIDVVDIFPVIVIDYAINHIIVT